MIRGHLLLFVLFFSPLGWAEQTKLPERIISLSPHLTELAFSAGLGSKLIAVSEYSDYPQAAQALETVANFQSINIERIVQLAPDLILARNQQATSRELTKLAELGFTLFYDDTQQLDDIAPTLLALSHYASDPSQGERAAKHYQTTLHTLRTHYNNAAKVRYFYLLNADPIMTVAARNWPDDIFQLCGGENVFANSLAPYPQVNLEQVLETKPEVIFMSGGIASQNLAWLTWETLLPAVQKKQVWTLNSDWLNRPTLRTLLAIEQVCDYLDKARN